MHFYHAEMRYCSLPGGSQLKDANINAGPSDFFPLEGEEEHIPHLLESDALHAGAYK